MRGSLAFVFAPSVFSCPRIKWNQVHAPATLVLIRHADIWRHEKTGRLCGWCDMPLTSLGRQQVALLRERLASEPPAAACYTSPLQRARATAEAAPPPLSPVPLDSLREISCGELDGMAVGEVQSRYPDLWQRNLALNDDDFAWPGGETYRQFRRRVLSAVEEIASRHTGQRVLLFTHAGFINQVMGTLAGAAPARWDLYQAGSASLTEVQWAGEFGAVVRFDDRGHLAALQPLKRAS